VKNALAYYETETITVEKSFKVLAPIDGEDGAATLSTTTLSQMTFSITINKEQLSAQCLSVVKLRTVYTECH
jgi:hypothetical protein